MKFFDYKFLILLGLTLVVYFIYREVEYLRSKVEKLESNIQKNNMICLEETKVLEDKSENKKPVLELPKPENKKPVLELPKPPSTTNVIEEKVEPLLTNVLNSADKLNTPNTSPKVISIGLDITSKFASNTNETRRKEKNSDESIEKNPTEPGIKVNPFQIINDITNQTDDESDLEDTSETTDSSNHVAIYSNDNDQLEETQNSLLESVEANKQEIKFQYDNQIPNINKTVNEIIDSISSDNDNKVMVIQENVSNENNQKESSENSLKESNDETKLNGMKLLEIKKIAEKKKIFLTKKVNGQPKPKNKQELINEILKK